MVIIFNVPPGIGDFSPIYSKLCGLNREIEIRPAMDAPPRCLEFVKLLPKVHTFGYGAFASPLVLENTLDPGTDLGSLEDGMYFLSVNQWLEEGHRIEDWVPGPTDFHYKIQIPQKDIDAANRSLGEITGFNHHEPLIGVYTTAYGNSRHWGFWGPHEWFEFLQRVRILFLDKGCRFVFIGAEYDLGISQDVQRMMLEYNENHNYDWFHAFSFVGKHEIGGTIEVIRNMDYFFSFPSGLGFLADVVNTPNTMWFPMNLDRMRYTFSDPENMGGVTQHYLFGSPEESANRFKYFGLHKLEEKQCQNQKHA